MSTESFDNMGWLNVISLSVPDRSRMNEIRSMEGRDLATMR